MADSAQQISEQIQRLVASLVATQPAGAGLWLVGGFRYRLLDRGVRRSIDIDYHWQGDLAAKRGELIAVFQRRLLPDVRRRLGLEGSAAAARGTGHESVAVMTIDLAFRRLGSTLGRIEIPVDILRIECVDPPAARTTDGIVYRTAPDAARRIRTKLARLNVAESLVRRRLDDLGRSANHHAKMLDAVIGSQLDPAAASTLVEVGGGRAVLECVRPLLTGMLLAEGPAP